MAITNQAVWRDMQSKLSAMGGVPRAVIGEPRGGLQSGLVAIIPSEMHIPTTVLDSWRELHTTIIRRYEAVEQQPEEQIEFKLDSWRAEVLDAFFGNYRLGNTIVSPEPTQFQLEHAETETGGRQWRILDINYVYTIDPTGIFEE